MILIDISPHKRGNLAKLILAFFWITILIFSSSDININFLNKASADTCSSNLSIGSVTASGNEAGYPPSNVLDNSLSTRWSNPGVGSWIRADLGTTKNICSVDIAWYKGNERQYNFAIATSTDGTTFATKLSGKSSGTTLNSEKYIISSSSARYVKVTVNGNNVNDYAHITELDIFALSYKFRVIKLYSTKSVGEKCYIDINKPLSDSRYNLQNTF